jgi:hypothetical protein
MTIMGHACSVGGAASSITELSSHTLRQLLCHIGCITSVVGPVGNIMFSVAQRVWSAGV